MPTIRQVAGHDPISEASLDLMASMLHSVHLALEHSDCTYEEYQSSNLIQDAVMYRILCAGEAAKKLEEEFKRESNWTHDGSNASALAVYNVPIAKKDWKGIIGMREKLAHAAACNQDLSKVWKTVTEDVPKLLPALIGGLGSASYNWFSSDDRPQKLTARQLILRPMARQLQDTMSHSWSSYLKSASFPKVDDAVIKRVDKVVEHMREMFADVNESMISTAVQRLAEINQGILEQAKIQLDASTMRVPPNVGTNDE